MKSKFMTLALLALTLLTCAGCGSDDDGPSGSSFTLTNNASFVLSGSAAWTSEGTPSVALVRLTPAVPGSSGLLTYAHPLRLDAGFSMEFDYRFTNVGADGLYVNFHEEPRRSDLIAPLVFDLDNYPNGSDPDANHVDFYAIYNGNTSPPEISTALAPGINMSDGAIHKFKVTYSGTAFRIFMDGNKIYENLNFNLTRYLPSGKANIELGARGYAFCANHDVFTWSASTVAK